MGTLNGSERELQEEVVGRAGGRDIPYVRHQASSVEIGNRIEGEAQKQLIEQYQYGATSLTA